jgi:hypothetical protein
MIALLETVQPCAVHGNLIVHLVRLPMEDFKLLIVRVRFSAYSATQLIESRGRAVQRIQVGVDLVIQNVGLRVGLELELGSIGKS